MQHRGGEGTTPVTTACPGEIAEGKTSYELVGWKVKVMIKRKKKVYHCMYVVLLYEVFIIIIIIIIMLAIRQCVVLF